MVKKSLNPFKRFFNSDANPVQSMKIIHTGGTGTTGTENYAGYSAEEYLVGLQNSRQRSREFDKMRRSDPQVKMCLRAVKSPIMAAKYIIEPFDQNDPESVKDAEMIKYLLFQAMDWKQFLIEALTIVDFGHAVFEGIDKVVESPEFGKLNAMDLSWRSPKTIERWNLDPATFKLKSITQIAYGDLYKYVDIPAEFLLVMSLEREGSMYEGVSMLRCIYGNWFRKNHYLKLNAIGIEKFAIPTPIVTVPAGMEEDKQFDNLTANLESYCAHEKAYLTIPEKWVIDMKTNTYDPQKVEVSIDNEDKRMVKSFMANFLELGINGFGSQSLSFDLSDFFLNAIESIVDIPVDGVNKSIIPRLVELNRGARKGYPKLKQTGISDKVGKEFAEMMKIYSDSKIITPDNPLEVFIRNKHSLPEMSDDGKRDVTPPAPQVNPPANPLLHDRLKRTYGKNQR